MRHFPFVDLLAMISWRNVKYDKNENNQYVRNAVEHQSLDSFGKALMKENKNF
jgi:hypothetical protein